MDSSRSSRSPSPDERFLTVGPHRVRLLHDGREAFGAMLRAIAQAREEILLEMYWFDSGRIGTEFRDALIERARAGVRVHVIYDAVGSLGTPRSFFAPLFDAGGDIHEFAPVSPLRRRFRIERVQFRDHRKILVVDGAHAFTGGINLGDAWCPVELGGEDYRDDAIELYGPVCDDLRRLFYESWRRAGRLIPADVGRMTRRPGEPVVVLASRLTHGRWRGIRSTYLRSVRMAKERIDIENAYFLPRPRLLHALRKACRRGVDVRILIPGQSDVWIMPLAMEALVGRLLRWGCRVFAYKGRILHAKTAVFDETMAMVGSANLDMRSWRYNRECNVAVYDAAVARLARASFERDLASAEEFRLDAWNRRSRIRRLAGNFAYFWRHIL